MAASQNAKIQEQLKNHRLISRGLNIQTQQKAFNNKLEKQLQSEQEKKSSSNDF